MLWKPSAKRSPSTPARFIKPNGRNHVPPASYFPASLRDQFVNWSWQSVFCRRLIIAPTDSNAYLPNSLQGRILSARKNIPAILAGLFVFPRHCETSSQSGRGNPHPHTKFETSIVYLRGTDYHVDRWPPRNDVEYIDSLHKKVTSAKAEVTIVRS